MKINITLDDALMQRIDTHADENYMSRSGLISLACTQYLNSQDVARAVKDFSLCCRKIADAGTVDEETQTKLEDLERFCNFLLGNS